MKGTVTVLAATNSSGSSTSGTSGSNHAAGPSGPGANPEAAQPRAGSASGASTKATSTLPNTGANLPARAAAGLALLTLGIALRHRTSRGKPGDENL
jgi:LPXTG-motif cell wall-anchored protein